MYPRRTTRWEGDEDDMRRQYVVINRSANGNLVAMVVESHSRDAAVQQRAAALRRGGYHVEILAATESHPSPHGLGGRVLRRVETVPPREPRLIATNQKVDTL